MRRWWQDLNDLVLPTECGGCGRQRAVLCGRCRAALLGTPPRRARPAPEPPGLPAVYAAARYGDEVRAALLAHKERGALALARPLGEALAGAVRAGLRGAGAAGSGREVLLVPVPSSRGAVRARGHDPARRIALAAAARLRATGTPAGVAAVLRQRRPVADQSGLDARRRADNLAGALAVTRAGGVLLAGGGRIVLVDDLVTTGASLAEAARAVGRQVRDGRESTAVHGDPAPPVYAAASREVRENEGEGTARSMVERRCGTARTADGTPGADGPAGLGRVVCAAVVAASHASFEINRN
ncbi:ComF family protein [Streptomyces sp. NPDC008150]|uniref:ComF family protein n=1 Tax=Streptomyces sp. NPDC008150 TaxID=3364816 RepID=UPI0036ED3B08